MAFRIDKYFERGEIDNRVKGMVKGRLWFCGLEEPVELVLEGNPWRDIAGCLVQIKGRNPEPIPQEFCEIMEQRQVGVVGDITASRKVRVPNAPMDEFVAAYKTGRTFTFHQANSLYLEWYSQSNGRVVIETTEFDLTIDGIPAWKMSEKEERVQRVQNEGGILNFMNSCGSDDDVDANEYELHEEEDKPASAMEAQADREDARMNTILDRVQVRLDRDQNAIDDFDKVYEEESQRWRKEHGEPEPTPPTPEQEAERNAWIAEMNEATKEALDTMDCEEMQDHPLVTACSTIGCKIWQTIEESGWLPEHAGPEHPLSEIRDGVSIAGAKLAGALNGRMEEEWPPDPLFAGDTLVRLKKARRYLRDALAGLDAADEQRLAESDWRGQTRLLIEGVLMHVNRLIEEVREQGQWRP